MEFDVLGIIVGLRQASVELSISGAFDVLCSRRLPNR